MNGLRKRSGSKDCKGTHRLIRGSLLLLFLVGVHGTCGSLGFSQDQQPAPSGASNADAKQASHDTSEGGDSKKNQKEKKKSRGRW